MVKEDVAAKAEELVFVTRKWTVPFFLAWILFIVSMFLPAYVEGKGWECAVEVFEILGDFSSMNQGIYYYYGAFNLGNLAMLLSPLFLRFLPPGPRGGRWIFALMLLCTLHVLSWAVVEMAENTKDIKYGYHLWAASFIIFTGEWARQTFLRPLKV